jgi:hypothetical protein
VFVYCNQIYYCYVGIEIGMKSHDDVKDDHTDIELFFGFRRLIIAPAPGELKS